MTLGVCVAGATGWAGRAIAEGVLAADDLRLVSAVTRSTAGQDLGTVWGGHALGVPVHASVADALGHAEGDAHAAVDVLVDYTSHDAVLGNTLAALEREVAVVVGTSGLAASDYEQIERAARAAEVGVVAAGNFSLTAAMAQAAAVLVAPYLPHREVIDYASATKVDAPSGTARELAERLGALGTVTPDVAVHGYPEARGADIGGTPVHSLRLPGFVVSTEVVFGLPDERLVIRHDAGSSPAPYVAGTLLAVRAVPQVVGLVRGLDRLLLAG